MQSIKKALVNKEFKPYYQPQAAQFIRQTINSCAIAPESITIEIPENKAIPETLFPEIFALKELGTTIALDDFGSGHANLASLQSLPIDLVKLDRCLLKDDPRSRIILHSVIEMFHKLNLQILVEGVENQEQYALLKSLGCHQVQGYYFSPPVPPQTLENLLAREQAVQQAIRAQRQNFAPESSVSESLP